MKKLKKILAEYNRKSNHVTYIPKKDEDQLWKELVIEYVQKEQYLSAFLQLQQKLREQAKNNQLIEDKRTEITE